MRRRSLAVLALAASFLAACDEGRKPIGDDLSGSGGPSNPGGQTSQDALLQAKVDRIDAQVAAIRGLEFRRPVEASWVPRSRIGAVQDSLARALGYSTDTTGDGVMDEVFQALGYLDSTSSMGSSSEDFTDQYVLAFYVRGTDHLWVASDQANSSDLDQTIAHELVHALQDQNFPDETDWIEELDESEAYKFLSEGEAEYVSNLWALGDATVAGWDSYARSFSSSLFAAWVAQSSYAGERPILVWPGIAPYLCGTTFVHEVRKASGWAGVDAIHTSPVRTTTQALAAGSGGLGRTFLDWSTSAAFASMSDRRGDGSGRLGEIYLDALLSTWNAPVLSDWNGDRFWIWGAGGGMGTAVAGRTAWRTAASASDFLAGWKMGMSTMVGGTPGGSSDSLEFRSSDSVHFARGVRRGAEVLMVWGDLRQGRMEALWSDLSRVPAAGTFARSQGAAPASAGPRWKPPRSRTPFWR